MVDTYKGVSNAFEEYITAQETINQLQDDFIHQVADRSAHQFAVITDTLEHVNDRMNSFDTRFTELQEELHVREYLYKKKLRRLRWLLGGATAAIIALLLIIVL